jgi:uncharacterized protein (DUF427 family)
MIEPPLNTIPPTTPRREASRISALFHGHIIASSTDVIDIATLGAPPQRYFPKADVGMSYLRPVDTIGDGQGAVTRYSLYRDGEIVENAAWSYDRPGNPLAGRIAFRDGLVRYDVTPLEPGERAAAEETRSWDANHQPSQRGIDVDTVVRHTDSGSGNSQAEHWAPNVEGPDENRDPAAPAQPYRGTGSI